MADYLCNVLERTHIGENRAQTKCKHVYSVVLYSDCVVLSRKCEKIVVPFDVPIEVFCSKHEDGELGMTIVCRQFDIKETIYHSRYQHGISSVSYVDLCNFMQKFKK